MFYRIKDNEIYDYADYRYEQDCLEMPEYTAEYIRENPEAFKIEDGILINIEGTEAYTAKVTEKNKQKRIYEIEQELNELDLKRIRAVAEPELKDAESGETWLEYYNTQISELRAEYAALI